jgi:hypothetical protein
MGKMRNALKIFGKPKAKKPFGISRLRREANIRMDLRGK